MKRLIFALGLLVLSGGFYVQGAAASQPFGWPCEQEDCVTIGTCHTSCQGCEGPAGGKVCKRFA